MATRVLGLATVGLVLAGAATESVSLSACTAAATNNPMRSFANAKDVDVVCMQTLTIEDGGGIPPVPLPQAACTPVPAGLNGALLTNHLFALVTQTQRGEVAVVDLTAGVVIDEDLGTPGINFLPVGQMPTGIAAAPDGKMSYVAAAEVNKPALYGLPSTLILGNSQALDGGRAYTPPLLTTWPACALPQAPGPIAIVPTPPPEPSVDAGNTPADGGKDSGAAKDAVSDTTTHGEAGGLDGGVEDGSVDASSPHDGASDAAGKPDGAHGGKDAGDAGADSGRDYVLAVVLPGGQGGQPARVVTIDPLPLMRGGGVIPADRGPVDPPAQLVPCTILGEAPLSGAVVDAGVGPTWSDGVLWIDAAVDAQMPTGQACTSAQPDAGGWDGGLPSPSPMPTSIARAGQYLYVADGALPLIHVFDLTDPTHLVEIEPLHATSLAQPGRAVAVSAIAVSPVTRNYQRFLYAVDSTDSPPSILVYEVTDPVSSPHVPLRRPHSELVPFEPQDRIQFPAGVSSLAFVQHDWPLAQTPGGSPTAGAALTGLLCNPNPNVDLFAADAAVDAAAFTDPGANYRQGAVPFADEPIGPMRLRGVFAFATLSNGQVVTIDVDDWDAPCRRPVTMGRVWMDAGQEWTSGYTNSITPPEPNIGSKDGGVLDPYEAPFTYSTNGTDWVTAEAFFPVSAPHRARSAFLLSNPASQGIHFPYLVDGVQLYAAGPDGGLGATVNGSIAGGNPAMYPTVSVLPDPSVTADAGLAVGIRLAWEDPVAHIDQSWAVDYEGKLPTFANIEADLVVSGEGLSAERPAYYTLFVGVPGGQLCSRGVEDWTLGQQRAASFLAASAAAGVQPPENLKAWVGDYVQVADDLLPPSDPYWSSDPLANDTDDCWAGFNASGADAGSAAPITDPTARYNTCFDIFGYAGDQWIARDFPVVQAFDDGFVVTRFNYPVPTDGHYAVAPSTSNRQITVPDVTNISALKQLKCCFHSQMTFNVRAGGEWVTTGSVSGLLHHVIADSTTHRCVTSCDPQKALLNSRAIGMAASVNPKTAAGFIPDRDNPLAMRNPMFAFFIEHPWADDPNVSAQAPFDGGLVPQVVARPARDFDWQFSLKGEISPLTVNLAATNTTVSPQSMLFIPSIGQLAIVDGSLTGQGLILVDLNTVTVGANTYY